MDFWSRLLSPLAAGSPRKDQAKDPAKRLHRFEKEYAKLLSTWRTSSNLSRDSEAAETLEIRLQELTNILSDESRRPLPHPCIQYASIKQIYVPIGKIATTSYNEWIIKEAVLLFATLIESEEEAFVENPTFSASLTNLLVRITGVNSVRLGLDTESRVVELAFNITTKIRLDPAILPAWFKTPLPNPNAHGETDLTERDRFAGRTQRVDFPLFYILMDYIHHEGKVGDFARTGLLYIIEAASSSAALEQWIVESDLSTLMATGLGALYSQLSRKLVIDHLPHDLPPILALSDYEHPSSNYEIISSCSPEFQSHLETFLSHLLFWQDVLNHCRSVEVKSTLLEHFQVIFLQQLLYPSLLESSDIDGGSSVAVLTYLRRILESLDHPDMINLILHYLLALPDAVSRNKKPSRSSVSEARKRKSMDLTKMMAAKAEEPATPLLFNLVDLILSCLRSRNQQTIHVTLQLVSAILKRHHRYAVFTLLRTDLLSNDATRRTVGAHEQEVDYLVGLAGAIGGKANFDDVYANILKDTMARVESHPCSLRRMIPRVSANGTKLPPPPEDTIPGAPREMREHTLRPDDALLNEILDLLETFFMNSVETNLSVSETLVDLAICGYINIEGWFSRDPATYSYAEAEAGAEAGAEAEAEDEDELEHGYDTSVASEMAEAPPQAEDGSFCEKTFDEAQRVKSIQRCRSRPKWIEAKLPRILQVLKRLSDQVTSYKRTIPRFDDLLEQRRDAFQTAESMLDGTFSSPGPSGRKATPTGPGTPERPKMDEALRAASPPRPSTLEGFAQRLLSELGTTAPRSRSASPKIRHEYGRLPGTSSTPGSYPGAAEPMTPNSFRVPPKDLPLHYSGDTLVAARGGNVRSFSLTADIRPSAEEQDLVAESQASVFAAFDQSILSRRVGLPDDSLSPIPLDLRKEAEAAGRISPAQEPGPDKDHEHEHELDQEQEQEQVKEKEPGPGPEQESEQEQEPGPGPEQGQEQEQEQENEQEQPQEQEQEQEPEQPQEPEQKPDQEPEPAQGQDADDSRDDGRSDTSAPNEPRGACEATVSVSHLLTNIIIYQSFLLELASLLQVRAGLFGEVRYA
ncbi:hypothetical protein E4U42_003622 [Claviceps africana]|uniref:Retinoic acid induced 16-like protein-domain-containing protein n=1 Tax=Claviceps africana TaxID=83212 RepID=A0A8K0JCU9_9HYPO|nr:hypothetical protein E4U42_003622 [Claviceps africana]